MGWTFSHKDSNETTLQYLQRQGCFTFAESKRAMEIVATSSSGSTLFVAVRIRPEDVCTPDQTRVVTSLYETAPDGSYVTAFIFLTKRDARQGWYNFGYKDMDESCGPNAVGASDKFLSLLSPLRADSTSDCVKWAAQWRDRCRAANAAKKARGALAPGDAVLLPEPLSFSGAKLRRFVAVRLDSCGRRNRKTGKRASLTCFTSPDAPGFYRLRPHNLQSAKIRPQADEWHGAAPVSRV